MWSLEECHFQQHGTRCDMWVPAEETDPFVRHAPTRRSVALFGAVNVKTGQLITFMTPLFDASSFEAFLRLLLRHRRRGRRLLRSNRFPGPLEFPGASLWSTTIAMRRKCRPNFSA